MGTGVRLRKKYEKRVSQHALADVHFTGYATYSDLPRYYKTADIACFPSTGWESQGIVLLEAMAVGKPIIASDIDGYSSVLTNGVEGISVPPRNAEKLAEALLKLIKDKNLRREMGDRGKPRAMQYDWSLLAHKLLDFYTETLNKVNHHQAVTEEKSSQVRLASGQH